MASSSGSPRFSQGPSHSAPEQHELLQQQLRRNVISRRNVLLGMVSAAGAAFLLGNGYGSRAFADQLSGTGTVAGGFVVNGRHLSFGVDPQREMAVAGQLFNLNKYNAVPSGIKVRVQYGIDGSYGKYAPTELRELVTHVPVWNGVPKGPVTASTTDLLNATQFYVHAYLDCLEPGQAYDYYDPADPDYYDPTAKTAPADISPVAALVTQITRVRNPVNHTPTRFNLLAGDICYVNPSGDAVAIINPDGVGGKQPGTANTPAPPVGSGGWDDFDPYVWTSYLSTIEPSSASAPWMFATGNHDVELFSAALGADTETIGYYGSIGYGGHAQRLDLPRNGPSTCPSVYSFTYSNVAVVSIDANDLSYEIQGLLGYSHGRQAHWLKRTLAAFRADPAIDFIVVFYHHCAFSTCASHSSDGGASSVEVVSLSPTDA